MTIGEKIKKCRIASGYKSQVDFARDCFLTPSAVCQYENDRRTPSMVALLRISEVCRVSIDYLIKKDGKQDTNHDRDLLLHSIYNLTNDYNNKDLSKHSNNQLNAIKKMLIKGIPFDKHQKVLEIAKSMNYDEDAFNSVLELLYKVIGE